MADNSRISEFFEDNTDRLSMIRLISFIACLVSSGAILLSVYSTGTVSEGLLGVYLTAWCLLGANSKYQETRPEVEKAKAAAPPAIIKQENAVNNVDAT